MSNQAESKNNNNFISLALLSHAQGAVIDARFRRRRTSSEPNRMLMRKNKEYSSLALDSALVKYGV